MSQSLKEAIAANPALADEFKVAIAKAVVEFAKSKGLDLTKNTELSQEDLEKVAGGGIGEDIVGIIKPIVGLLPGIIGALL